MNCTDEQLKQALAKMLPETCYMTQPDNKLLAWNDGRLVLDTELLDLCNRVELTLSWSEYSIFRKGLMNQLMRIESASWQQRVKSLAITKGIEL